MNFLSKGKVSSADILPNDILKALPTQFHETLF